MDSTLIDHEQRLTRLEDRFEVNLPGMLARLQKLEETEAQRKKDAEQVAGAEVAALRRELAELKQSAGKAG